MLLSCSANSYTMGTRKKHYYAYTIFFLTYTILQSNKRNAERMLSQNILFYQRNSSHAFFLLFICKECLKKNYLKRYIHFHKEKKKLKNLKCQNNFWDTLYLNSARKCVNPLTNAAHIQNISAHTFRGMSCARAST